MTLRDEQIALDHQSRVAVVLRWVALLPSALLACAAGRFVIVLINRLGMSRYVEPDSFMWRVVDQYVSGLALGAVFVYVASWVAPIHKKPVAVCAAGLALVLAGFLLFPSILVGDYWAIFEILCMGFGASGVAYGVLAEEIVFDRGALR